MKWRKGENELELSRCRWNQGKVQKRAVETRTSLRTKVDLHINDDQTRVFGRKIAIVRPRIRGVNILIRHGSTQHEAQAESTFLLSCMIFVLFCASVV
jgi:hypothetical protein